LGLYDFGNLIQMDLLAVAGVHTECFQHVIRGFLKGVIKDIGLVQKITQVLAVGVFNLIRKQGIEFLVLWFFCNISKAMYETEVN